MREVTHDEYERWARHGKNKIRDFRQIARVIAHDGTIIAERDEFQGEVRYRLDDRLADMVRGKEG